MAFFSSITERTFDKALETYARWGVDYLKYDWCNTGDRNAKEAYALMADALRWEFFTPSDPTFVALNFNIDTDPLRMAAYSSVYDTYADDRLTASIMVVVFLLAALVTWFFAGPPRGARNDEARRVRIGPLGVHALGRYMPFQATMTRLPTGAGARP